MEEVSGGRMHYMFNRVGGLKEDLPAGLDRRGRAPAVADVRSRLPDARRPDRSATRSSGPAPADVGVLSTGAGRTRTASAARSPAPSGVDFDLRRDEPYLAYGELFARRSRPGRHPRRRATAWPASRCLLEQIARLARPRRRLPRPARRLPPGPINVRLPKVLKVPEGHIYAWTENPLGLNGYYLVSRGREDPVAAQAALRVVQQRRRCCTELLPGDLVADMVAILGSMFFVVGDIDK